MKTAILKRSIPFKFGEVLSKGTKVEITQDMGASCLVKKINKKENSCIEYKIVKSALRR